MITIAQTTVPREVIAWLERFEAHAWSGSLTLHFNRGIVQSFEPKPTVRLESVK